MSCGCSSSKPVTSFNDLLCLPPTDPLDIISNVVLTDASPESGIWSLESTYLGPTGASVWINSGITLASVNTVTTNHSDNEQMVFDATEWNMAHQLSTSTSASTAPPLRKVVFMRAGSQWTNTIALDFPASPTFTELQLSLLDNAATRGDAQGTVPVFRWSAGAPYAGSVTLAMTFRQPGRFQLGLLGIDNASTPNWSMFELDVVAL